MGNRVACIAAFGDNMNAKDIVTDNGDGTYTHKIEFDPDIKKRISLAILQEIYEMRQG